MKCKGNNQPPQVHPADWSITLPRLVLIGWYVCVCTYVCVGHGVVPPEDPGGGKVSNHHVDAVVLVANQDAEDSRGAEQPAGPVIPPHPPRRVWTTHNTYIIYYMINYSLDVNQSTCIITDDQLLKLIQQQWVWSELTLFDEKVGQRQHDGVSAVQEVATHQVSAGQRQTWTQQTNKQTNTAMSLW